jgi:lysophospholipase L1-like esterase
MRALVVCLLLSTSARSASSNFYLHTGDTVVFYGDSITNQRLYTTFTEAYVLTRFPGLKVRFVQSGYSGDRVSGGFGGSIDERLQHDVFAFRPTVVTIMLGMNDGEYQPYDAAIFNKFASGYCHILDRLGSELPKARIALLEPSAYDDVTRPPAFPGGYNSVLLSFGKYLRKLAGARNLPIADLNAPVVSLLRATKEAAGTEAAQRLIPDRVHPSPGVHMILAEALLKSWHAPAIVTTVEIDAAKGVVTNAANTAIDKLELGRSISWTQTDRALPMPLDPPNETIALALRNSDFHDALNQETLKIDGLSVGKYRLRIDEDDVGTFDDAALARGINLATLVTPMSRQAQAVLDLTHRHNHLHFARWKLVDVPLKEYKLANTRAAISSLDALEEEVVALQRATALPKPHRYRLERQVSPEKP